jgi:anti-anti-sigma factor
MMEAEFSLTSQVQDEVLVIHTSGYVNNEGGEQIAREFEKHFENGLKKVIINLEKSKVVNSIGISYLIEVIDRLNEADGKMIFTNLEPAIEKMLSIMGLFEYADKEDNVESALKAIGE